MVVLFTKDKTIWLLKWIPWTNKILWANALRPSDAYIRRQPRTSLFQIMACRLFRTNAGTLSIGPWKINFGESLIEIYTFSLTKLRMKMSSVKSRPICLGLNVFYERNRLPNPSNTFKYFGNLIFSHIVLTLSVERHPTFLQSRCIFSNGLRIGDMVLTQIARFLGPR